LWRRFARGGRITGLTCAGRRWGGTGTARTRDCRVSDGVFDFD
jgi:hypothetical protein